MPVTVSIPDSSLQGLSAPARQELESKIQDFATDLISESNRIEATNRSPSDAADVSAQMVRDACTFVRRGMISKPPSVSSKMWRLGSALLSLLVGIAWDKDSIQNSSYIIFFGFLIAVTILTVSYSLLKE